jgi:hypothetical protein
LKRFLKPGEENTVTPDRKISAEILLSKPVNVKSTTVIPNRFTMDSTLADIYNEPAAAQLVAMLTKQMEGKMGSSDALGMHIGALLSSIKLSTLGMMGQCAITPQMLDSLLQALNAG